MSGSLRRATALLAAILLPAASMAQEVAPVQAAPDASAPAKSDTTSSKPVSSKPISTRDRRRAAKLYIEASKLFERAEFERAMNAYEQAAKLVPDNTDYALAAQVAKSHLVTSLIQSAAKERNRGDAAAARAALEKARTLDPKNEQVAQHVDELADDAARALPRDLYAGPGDYMERAPRLAPNSRIQSFHLKIDRRQLIQKVYKAYGIDATLDQSVPATTARFDLDDATFAQARQALEDTTNTFGVTLDPHRVVVARDTKTNRDQFQRQETETIYLSGVSKEELTEISNIAKNVFGVPQVSALEGKDTITLRALPQTLDAFNATMKGLLDGQNQVMLDVQILQLAKTNDRNTGLVLPQQITAFNVYSEEQAILSANQALVDQIISSGLASANDPLAILGILIASGAVSSSLFGGGIATFGGGLTLTGIAPRETTLQLALNSSETRVLDNVRLRLADGQEETLRNGSRYPIMVASYSGLASSTSGLTAAGTSSALASLLAASTTSTTTIPAVQYQDLGLTLKARPQVMRNGDVALNMDLKLTALSGNTIDSMPILNNRSYSGVVTLKAGEGALLVSEISEEESRSLTGIPGLSEIPGMSNLTGKDMARNYASLLVVLTPHVLKGPVASGRTRMTRIDRGSFTR
jgi:general secretion pathway protein D